MFGQKQEQRTHRKQFINELNEGVGALRRAAGHLASGTAEHLSPTYDRARAMAGRGWESTRGSINPMYQSLRENAGQMQMRPGRSSGGMKGGKRKAAAKQNSRFKGLATLLAAGAAVGAAGAAVARRRRNMQAEWEEYDPMTGETRYFGEHSRYGDESAYGQRSMRDRVATGAASMADSLSDRAGRIADTLHERGASAPSSGPQSGQKPMNQPPSGSGSSVPGTTPMPPGNPLHGPGAPLAFPDES